MRRLYFSDDLIESALKTLMGAVPEGDHLLIADNSRIQGMPARAGLYRRVGDRFVEVGTSVNLPEISDLVKRVGS